MSLGPLLLAVVSGCAYRAPVEPPAFTVAAGHVPTVALPAGSAVRLALRAGSAHDPPGREGLAWVTAHAVARSVGADVEVGPEIVVFSVPADRVGALAAALVAPPAPEAVVAARGDAVAALGALDCRAVASRAWDAWVYAGHPYGHAPEGRTSVLDTLTAVEVAGFQEVRYVRSVAVLGVPAGGTVDPAVFDVLPPRLSVSPVPSVRMHAPDAQVLLVTAADRRCLFLGEPDPGGVERSDPARALVESMTSPGGAIQEARRQPRRSAFLPFSGEIDPWSYTSASVAGGWLPAWQATRVLAPEATIPDTRALADALLAMDPYPSLARPLAGNDRVAGTPPTPVSTDDLLAGWLAPDGLRAVLVLPPDAPTESLPPAVVQAAVPVQELLR